MKIGIIGCGAIANTHLSILNKIAPDAELYLCDVNPSNAQRLAQLYNPQGLFNCLDDLLMNEHLDTAHILTPASSHFELSKRALETGCHVYCEKPVTERASQYRQLLGLANENERLFYAGYSALGMPVVMKTMVNMASGQLGELIAVHCDFMCSWPGNVIPYGSMDHWAYSLQGGILQNMVDHPLSLIVDALDEVHDYHVSFCRRNLLPHDCLDLMHLVLCNENQFGSFNLSLGHGSAHRQIHYFFEKGTITADLGRQLFSINRGSGPPGFIDKTLAGIKLGAQFAGGTLINIGKVLYGTLRKDPGVTNLLSDFYATILNHGKPEIVSPETIHQVTLLLEHIWQAQPHDATVERTESAMSTEPKEILH